MSVQEPHNDEKNEAGMTSSDGVARSTSVVGSLDAIRVPEDCPTVPEALRRAVPTQTIHISAGDYTWNDRIIVDKVVNIIGEKDPISHAPLTILSGR
jgi:hypothetical protein